MDKANKSDEMELDITIGTSRSLIKEVVYHCPGATTSTYIYYKQDVNGKECQNGNTSKFDLFATEDSSENENVPKVRGVKRPYPWPYFRVYEPPAKMIRYSYSYHLTKYAR